LEGRILAQSGRFIDFLDSMTARFAEARSSVRIWKSSGLRERRRLIESFGVEGGPASKGEGTGALDAAGRFGEPVSDLRGLPTLFLLLGLPTLLGSEVSEVLKGRRLNVNMYNHKICPAGDTSLPSPRDRPFFDAVVRILMPNFQWRHQLPRGGIFLI